MFNFLWKIKKKDEYDCYYAQYFTSNEGFLHLELNVDYY